MLSDMDGRHDILQVAARTSESADSKLGPEKDIRLHFILSIFGDYNLKRS